MTTSRLISTFTLDATNNVITVAYDGGADTDITLDTGVYHWSCDDSAVEPKDFAYELKDKLEDEGFDGNATWTIRVRGVDLAGSGVYHEGEVYSATNKGNPYVIKTNHANALDPRIMGMSGNSKASSGATWVSDHVHRYGFYPEDVAIEDIIRSVCDTHVGFSSGRYRSGVDWGEYGTIKLVFDVLPSALARVARTAESGPSSDAGLTQGDTNAAVERFILDLSRNCGESWRYYPVSTVTGTKHGPYVWPPGSILWRDPLGQSMIREAAGESWTIVLNGIDAVG